MHHLGHGFLTTNVSRVDPQTIYSCPQRIQGEAMIEVDIGDKGRVCLPFNGLQGFNCLCIHYCQPNDLATNLCQPSDLFKGGGDVASIRVTHRLYHHRGISAHRYWTNVDLSCLSSCDTHLTVPY